MNVLLDVDGPICDWLGGVLEVVEEVSGKRIQRSDVKKWLIFSDMGLSEDQVAKVNAEISQPGWCASLKPVEGAKEAIEELRDIGCEIHFVTSPWRCVNWTYERENWLVAHGMAANTGQVTHTSQKHLLRGDILVDDSPGNVTMWQKANPEGQGLLWNASYNYTSDLYRIGGWKDLINYVIWRVRK